MERLILKLGPQRIEAAAEVVDILLIRHSGPRALPVGNAGDQRNHETAEPTRPAASIV